jgi:hypothetical protein
MDDKDKSDGWDEDLEDGDELACLHKDPVSTCFLASGISRSMFSHFLLKFTAPPIYTDNAGSSISLSKGGLCYVKLFLVNILIWVLYISTDAGNKSEKKPRFSIRGYDFVPYDVKTEILHMGGHEGTSGVPSTKLSQAMVAQRLENIEEESEDLTPEFPLHTKKANTSVSGLLENLQGRTGSSVRKPSTVCVFSCWCVVVSSFGVLQFSCF